MISLTKCKQDDVKAGIERGRKQAAEGKLTPHDEVMKKYAM